MENPLPCDTIDYADFEQFKNWDDQLDDAKEVMKQSVGAELFALSRTPKNIGDAKN